VSCRAGYYGGAAPEFEVHGDEWGVWVVVALRGRERGDRVDGKGRQAVFRSECVDGNR